MRHVFLELEMVKMNLDQKTRFSYIIWVNWEMSGEHPVINGIHPLTDRFWRCLSFGAAFSCRGRGTDKNEKSAFPKP